MSDAVSDDNPSLISHVSIGTDAVERAMAFYDTVLQPLGARRIMEHSGAVAYGRVYPEFWVQRPADGAPYYGCFVRDPDGHKFEATYWDMALAREPGMA